MDKETVYPGRKGSYVIEADHKGYLVVKYISGPWEGKTISMSKTTHNRIQENIEIDKKTEETQEREELNYKLDLWYMKYPSLYKSLWYEHITSKKLLEELEKEYPDAASNINIEAQ